MPLILGAQSAVATGFSVDNSCRFNDDDGAYLSITPGAGNQKTATWSVWCKYTTQGHDVWGSYLDSTHFLFINFNSNGTFEFRSKDGSYVLELETDAEYRDPASWYHVCIALDTTESVEADRAKIWINGVQLTSFSLSNYPSLNADMEFNTSSHPTRIGDGTGAPERTPYDGYMAEFVFIDGTAYEASDFGEFDEDSPTMWKPKDPSGLTFGTNGYYLDFQDSADLGNDVSGEGNDFASTNLAAADQATDSPTNSFATLNPLDAATSSGITYSEGNTLAVGAAAWRGGSGTFGASSGKWYWECKMTGNYSYFGVATAGYIAQGSANYEGGYLGFATVQHSYSYGNDGKQYTNDASGSQTNSAYGTAYTTELIGVALNLDDNELKFYRDNVVQNSGTPISIASGFIYLPYFSFHTVSSGPFNFGGCSGFAITSAVADGNGYGQFEYAPPSGYLAICTKNLATDGG
jgi:hypothetical protein